MKFVAPNAVPRLKRNFASALDRMFFFDDQTDQSELTQNNWHLLFTKVRAGSYSFDGTVWKTGHVQGQYNSSRYYPANLGQLPDMTSTASWSSSYASNTSIPVSKPIDMLDFLTFDPDTTDPVNKPLGLTPKKLFSWGGNGYSAPDGRILYAMKAVTNSGATAFGKLETPFSKSNMTFTSGGGYNSTWENYTGRFGITRIAPKTVNGNADSDVTSAGETLWNQTDPNITYLLAGDNAAAMLIFERVEQYSSQRIYAAGSGSGPRYDYNYYNFNRVKSVIAADNATFNEAATKPFYFPINGTPETPNIVWGAILMQWVKERVFLKLDANDIVGRTATPGRSIQVTAVKTFVAPITDKQIFLM